MKLNADSTHPEYDNNEASWEFFVRSYMGGQNYFDGAYLTRYISETTEDYNRRLDLTPLDNHCKNIVHIYSSFLWRVSPTRIFNSATGNVALDPFLGDADLDGRSFNAFMRECQIWASVYGHVWVMMDKPKSTAGTKAEELAQDIRPYVTMFTPENVLDWDYQRTASGRFELAYLKVRESVIRVDQTTIESYYRVWYKDKVELWKSTNDLDKLVETDDNVLGTIPAVFLPANRSVVRGIGISDLSDAAYMQRSIYQELSEIEQLIRISNHPTLVKSFGTDASAGAGAIINMPDDMDASLKPFQLQPSGQNLDAVRASITDKVNSINRMSHMGAVRGTEAITMSGVAMQTEFQMLNAKLSEKADLLELAEEQLWILFAQWQGITPDVEIFYPDSFDLRDYDKELMFLQQLRSTGVKSVTLAVEIDKRIADLILDDEALAKAHLEIEDKASVLGDFSDKTQIYGYHIDAGVVTANEVREKIGLEDVDGGDALIEPKVEGAAEGNAGQF
tara:strand:+ start:736 stop:2253 length:1518 start_codon:yes stop_codon:yes gene_type:complete